MAAGQAQRLFDATRLPSIIVDSRGKPRWHPIWEGNPAIVEPGMRITAGYQQIVNGPNCRPYIVYPFTEETGWTFNTNFRARDHVAKIYLHPEERIRGQLARQRYGSYILIEPWSKHRNLRWPFERWAELVETLRPYGYHVVQHVHANTDVVIPGVATEEATFREACALVEASSVYIRGESGMCHATAALRHPQITLWGGCMDWDVLGGYPGQIGVGIQRPFCGSYKPCDHCRECMASIQVEDVVSALVEVGVR